MNKNQTYLPGNHPNLPPPPGTVGFAAWIKNNLFSDVKNTILTILCMYLLFSFVNAAIGWFVLDSVIGKHEYIDYAVALSDKGSVKAIEILVYREGYGDAVVNPRWRAQFYDKDPSRLLTHGKEIMNISGATLSCRHITDGINRLTKMWELVFSKV